MKKYSFIIPLLLSLIVCSCDIIDKDDILIPVDFDSIQTEQKMVFLIEEFTGNMCPNCPRAAEEAEKLMRMYPGQIIVMAIHSGFFAMPVPSKGYIEDFRTPEGTEIHNFFGLSGYPKGMINRQPNSAGTYLLDYGEWDAVISQLADQDPGVDLSISTSYNSISHQATVTVNSVIDLEGVDAKLCVFITESNLICQQADGENVVPDYVHDHVLRGSFNGTWGESIKGYGKDSKTYSITLDEKWIPENCDIVAYVYHSSLNHIFQACTCKLIQ